MKNLLTTIRNKFFLKQNLEEVVENPFGEFLREEKVTFDIGVDLDVIVHFFKKGSQITILYNNKRKFSRFFPNKDL